METCGICLGPLPPWPGRGRPRTYCDKTCRDRARYLAELEQAADLWRDRGYPAREAHVRGVIEKRFRHVVFREKWLGRATGTAVMIVVGVGEYAALTALQTGETGWRNSAVWTALIIEATLIFAFIRPRKGLMPDELQALLEEHLAEQERTSRRPTREAE